MRTGRRDAESAIIGLLLLACDTKDARVGSVNPQDPSAGTGGGTGAAAGLAGEDAGGGTTTFTGGTSSGGTTGGSSTGGTLDTGGEAGAARGGAVGSGGAQGGAAGTNGNGVGAAAGNAGAGSGSGGTAAGSSGEGGTAGGRAGGSGGMPPTTACMLYDSTAVSAALLDENGLMAALPSTPVTVVSVGPSPEGTPYVSPGVTREILLRDGAAKEWRYHVGLPGMPDDLVKAGDALILTSTIVRFFSDGQLIVLGTASELVVFTVSAPLDTPPNLDSYGLTLGYGAATCTSSTFLCTGSESPILITSGNSTQSIQPQETKTVFSLSFTNARTFRHDDTFSCSNLDPPDSFIYGAFRLAN